jgi:hypothetical protein
MTTDERETVIACSCAVCDGRRARVRGDGVTYGGTPLTLTVRHNLVALAHGPLARAASVRAHGPWAA